MPVVVVLWVSRYPKGGSKKGQGTRRALSLSLSLSLSEFGLSDCMKECYTRFEARVSQAVSHGNIMLEGQLTDRH